VAYVGHHSHLVLDMAPPLVAATVFQQAPRGDHGARRMSRVAALPQAAAVAPVSAAALVRGCNQEVGGD